MQTCGDVEGCDRPATVKGLCRKHYIRGKRAEARACQPPKEKVARLCTEPGCGQPHKAQGYCNEHYGKWYNRTVRKTTPKPPAQPAVPYLAAAEAIDDDLARLRCVEPEELAGWRGDGSLVKLALNTSQVRTADRVFCHDAAGARAWCEQQRKAGRCIRTDQDYQLIVSYD